MHKKFLQTYWLLAIIPITMLATASYVSLAWGAEGPPKRLEMYTPYATTHPECANCTRRPQSHTTAHTLIGQMYMQIDRHPRTCCACGTIEIRKNNSTESSERDWEWPSHQCSNNWYAICCPTHQKGIKAPIPFVPYNRAIPQFPENANFKDSTAKTPRIKEAFLGHKCAPSTVSTFFPQEAPPVIPTSLSQAPTRDTRKTIHKTTHNTAQLTISLKPTALTTLPQSNPSSSYVQAIIPSTELRRTVSATGMTLSISSQNTEQLAAQKLALEVEIARLQVELLKAQLAKEKSDDNNPPPGYSSE